MRSRGENRFWWRSGCGPCLKVYCIQYVKYLITQQNITISGASHQLQKNLPGSCLRGKLALQKNSLTIELCVSQELRLLLARNL